MKTLRLNIIIELWVKYNEMKQYASETKLKTKQLMAGGRDVLSLSTTIVDRRLSEFFVGFLENTVPGYSYLPPKI